MIHLLLALPLLAPTSAIEPHDLFRDLSLDEAIELSQQENKLVMLDAMTSWCGPCRQMELTTWRMKSSSHGSRNAPSASS